MNKLIKTGVVSFYPEIPAKEGTPAYCTVQRERQNIAYYKDGFLHLKVEWVDTPVCYPATPTIPSVPAEDSVQPMTGWNAGAVSYSHFKDNCEFKFNITASPAGVICGLSDGKKIRSYYHVAHGFLCEADKEGGRTNVSIIESGVIKKQLQLPYFYEFKIRALQGVIYYLVDYQLVYSSKNNIKGEIFAESTLYMINDYVNYPVFKSINDRIDNVQLLLNVSSGNMEGNYASIKLEPFEVTADTGNYLNIKLSLHANAFDGDYVGINAAVDPLLVEAYSDTSPTIQTAILTAELAPFYIEPTYMPIGGSANVTIPLDLKVGIITDYPFYAAANINIAAPELVIKQENIIEDAVNHQEFLMINGNLLTDSAFLIVFAEQLVINSYIDIGFVLSLSLEDSLLVTSDLSFSGALALLINEKIRIVSRSLAPENDVKNYQYAINASSYALSLYEDFDFIAFTRCNGSTYAIKQDGLYLLAGQTDNGQLINAEIDIGAKDWGAPNSKRVSSAYVGIRSDGDVYLKVVVDDKYTNVYRFEEAQSQRRSFMAKGVTGRYWRMKLVLEDISYAEIDSLEFEVGLSQRRIRR